MKKCLFVRGEVTYIQVRTLCSPSPFFKTLRIRRNAHRCARSKISLFSPVFLHFPPRPSLLLLLLLLLPYMVIGDSRRHSFSLSLLHIARGALSMKVGEEGKAGLFACERVWNGGGRGNIC